MNHTETSAEESIYTGCDGDKMKVIGRRIAHGKPIGESYLFGRLAHDLLESGYATFAELRKYRSALYFSDKACVGEDIAKRREEARLKRHEDAAIFKGYGKFSGSPEGQR